MSTNISNNLPIGITLQGKSYNYVIQKVLGQGTFGITYLAEVQMQGALGSIDSHIKVCIKEFFMHEINGREGATVTSGSQGGLYADYRKKFAREAQNLAKLQHPNIIKVLESFEENNTIYYVMEYVDGGSLDDYIEKKEHIPEQEVIELTKQIGSALSFMHKNKMLHLDLKPGNIMRKKEGTLVLIDFGLSKNYNRNGEPESSTTVGGGTPGYAPLEQSTHHDGHGFPVTMDIYALGATMYKMLTGVRAPEASSILNDGFPNDVMKLQGVSIQTVELITKAMNPLKKDRFQQVSELLNSLPEGKKRIDEDIPLRIDSCTTLVKINYFDGLVPNAIRYELIVHKDGKCYFTITELNGEKSTIQVKNFNWQEFRQMFNLQNLRYITNEGETFEGEGFISIELVNGKTDSIKAERQIGNVTNAGTLAGNISTLHNYVCSISEIKSVLEAVRNRKNPPTKHSKMELSIKDKSLWAFFASILVFLLTSFCIEWYYPFYAIGGLLFIGLLVLISLKFKKYGSAFISAGLLAGLLVGYFLNLNFVTYGIVGAGIIITLSIIALYSKRCRWVVSSLIMLGSLFNSYIWYSYNILQGHITDDNMNISEVSCDTTNENIAIKDTIIRSNYADICIGDYFYSDGSFSHELNKKKKLSGIVFSKETSNIEYKKGWTHGMIVSCHKDDGVIGVERGNDFISYNEWASEKRDLPKQHINILKDQLEKDYNGYSYSTSKYIKKYGYFVRAKDYPTKIPSKITSGWYLPSSGQWHLIINNISKLPNCYSIFHTLDIGNYPAFTYATSSEKDKNEFWSVYFNTSGNSASFEFKATDKKENMCIVVPVASF